MSSRMSDAEAIEEIHEMCRYGEFDELKEFLASYSHISIDSIDAHGNTFLHKACANGHKDIVAFLISKGCKHVRNAAGALPVSWCIMNKQRECFKLIVAAFPDIDVLSPSLKDSKRSILTEGYDAGDVEILSSLLKHPSANALDQVENSESKNSNEDATADVEVRTLFVTVSCFLFDFMLFFMLHFIVIFC
jgi:ankyrin repeat protein